MRSFQISNGDTALSVACQGGHTETAKVLLDKGAITDFQNEVRIVNNLVPRPLPVHQCCMLTNGRAW